ncbi:hypothetical protein GCM10010413_55000 [Promicromonospora sukumoe]
MDGVAPEADGEASADGVAPPDDGEALGLGEGLGVGLDGVLD